MGLGRKGTSICIRGVGLELNCLWTGTDSLLYCGDMSVKGRVVPAT